MIIQENIKNTIKEIIQFYNLKDISIEELFTAFRDSEYKYNKLLWMRIFSQIKLSEDFITEFQDSVDWLNICKKQKLSEDFIIKFRDKVKWNLIFTYQKLSKEFIDKYFKFSCIPIIFKYQNVSDNFCELYKVYDKTHFYDYNKIKNYKIYKNRNIIYYNSANKFSVLLDQITNFNDNEIVICEDNWMYKDYDFKYNKVKECGLYQIDGEYVIAYKGIRKDNYSYYNFQYQYLPGQFYESKADYNTNIENSFGLSAWTKLKALDYCNEKLIKVKIHINDIAALVHDSNKIRCTRFTVIEEVQ